jgi:hypothetical protein
MSLSPIILASYAKTIMKNSKSTTVQASMSNTLQEQTLRIAHANSPMKKVAFETIDLIACATPNREVGWQVLLGLYTPPTICTLPRMKIKSNNNMVNMRFTSYDMFTNEVNFLHNCLVAKEVWILKRHGMKPLTILEMPEELDRYETLCANKFWDTSSALQHHNDLFGTELTSDQFKELWEKMTVFLPKLRLSTRVKDHTHEDSSFMSLEEWNDLQYDEISGYIERLENGLIDFGDTAEDTL